MKETIYTIPVNEAFDTADGCPFCALARRLEDERVDYTLGASMMEPDARALTNSFGFCARHFSMLSERPNKLSLALVLDTHLQSVRGRLDAVEANIAGGGAKRSKLFQKKGGADTAGALLSAAIKAAEDGCAVCKSVDATMERYLDVVFYLWDKEQAFREKFDTCAGFCLPHYRELVQKCGQYLDADTAQRFTASLYKKQQEMLTALQEDIHKFTLKFDYRNKDMEWGTAKDAPQRVVKTLAGYLVQTGEDTNEKAAQ